MSTTQNAVSQLVKIHSGKKEAVTTTSLLVAEKFGKRHDDVLKAVRNLLSEMPPEGLRNFTPSSYVNNQNKKQPMYEMSRDGFSLLAMGFTGKKALEWKLKFISAFNMMEQALNQRKEVDWQNTRHQGKITRRGETDVIADFVQYAKEQGSKSADKYYMSITKMTYTMLFSMGDALPKPIRDMLDVKQLFFLATAESVIESAIHDGMNQGMFYKDVYQYAKQKLADLVKALPVRFLQVENAIAA